MGSNDAREQLEVAKAEMMRLEAENAELRDNLQHAVRAFAVEGTALRDRAERAEARIAAAIDLYRHTQDQPIGTSRWRTADQFLVAIRNALTEGNTNGSHRP